MGRHDKDFKEMLFLKLTIRAYQLLYLIFLISKLATIIIYSFISIKTFFTSHHHHELVCLIVYNLIEEKIL